MARPLMTGKHYDGYVGVSPAEVPIVHQLGYRVTSLGDWLCVRVIKLRHAKELVTAINAKRAAIKKDQRAK